MELRSEKYKQTEVGLIPNDWDVDFLEKYWTVTDCKHITAEFIPDGIPLASITEVQSLYVDLNDAMQTALLHESGGHSSRIFSLQLSGFSGF
ncbi:MAG: hypothetical protein ACKV1O_09905 [Saprospiraceae bacterium]